MEAADQILSARDVDPGLAAHRAVHLSQESRRDLHEIDAAEGDARGEAGEIANDAAAERQDGRLAVNAESQHRLDQTLQIGKTFRALAGREQNLLPSDTALRQRRLKRRQMQSGNRAVGDEQHARARENRS